MKMFLFNTVLALNSNEENYRYHLVQLGHANWNREVGRLLVAKYISRLREEVLWMIFYIPVPIF